MGWSGGIPSQPATRSPQRAKPANPVGRAEGICAASRLARVACANDSAAVGAADDGAFARCGAAQEDEEEEAAAFEQHAEQEENNLVV